MPIAGLPQEFFVPLHQRRNQRFAGVRDQVMQFADRLLIRLPKASTKRKALRKICQDLCDKRGGAFMPNEKDTGENHLFLLLE